MRPDQRKHEKTREKEKTNGRVSRFYSIASFATIVLFKYSPLTSLEEKKKSEDAKLWFEKRFVVLLQFFFQI